MLSVISRFNFAQEEPITGLAPDKTYITEKLNEQYTLNSTIMLGKLNEAAAPLIQHENLVRVSSTGQLYRIKQLNSTSRRRTPVIDLQAEHVFFDIIKVKQDKSTAIDGSATFEVAMNYALKGTGWNWQVVNGQFFALTYENFAGNALDLFKRLQTRHEFEWYPDSRTMTVYIYEQLGEDTEAQLRYNHNLINIKDKTTTTNLVNIRKGYGRKREFTEENPEPPVLSDRDYLCIATWRDDESIRLYGECWGADYENENYTIEENLRQYLASISEPYPIVSLDVNFAQLGEYGENVDNDTADLGNRIFVIYEPLNLDVNARIVARKIYPETTRKSPELTLSNVLETSVTQAVRLRQEVATLARETNYQLSRIGSISQGQGELATNFEELAAQQQTQGRNIAALANTVGTYNERIDQANATAGQANATAGQANATATSANETARTANTNAQNARTVADRADGKADKLLSDTLVNLTLAEGLTGTLGYVDTGAEIIVTGMVMGLIDRITAVTTLPRTMVDNAKGGLALWVSSTGGLGTGSDAWQVYDNELHILTSTREPDDNLIIDFSYRY